MPAATVDDDSDDGALVGVDAADDVVVFVVVALGVDDAADDLVE
jgi:hypothetical protein